MCFGVSAAPTGRDGGGGGGGGIICTTGTSALKFCCGAPFFPSNEAITLLVLNLVV